MRSWNLHEIEVEGGSRSPVVLDPNQSLGAHQVKEHAYVLVVDGKARVDSGGQAVEAGPGTLCMFDPDERRSVSTESGARILLLFAPWPGEGHYRGGGVAG